MWSEDPMVCRGLQMTASPRSLRTESGEPPRICVGKSTWFWRPWTPIRSSNACMTRCWLKSPTITVLWQLTEVRMSSRCSVRYRRGSRPCHWVRYMTHRSRAEESSIVIRKNMTSIQSGTLISKCWTCRVSLWHRAMPPPWPLIRSRRNQWV